MRTVDDVARPARLRLAGVLSLRPMTESDLSSIASWLALPHVAHRWLTGSTMEREVEKYRSRVREPGPTIMLSVCENGVHIGWSQWYRWSDYPRESRAVGAGQEEIGIDYAIGEPSAVCRGLGTAMIAALVVEVRHHHAGAGVLVTPEASNVASRRVLEKNGLVLVDTRPVVTESTDAPMAIYRLAPEVPARPSWVTV